MSKQEFAKSFKQLHSMQNMEQNTDASVQNYHKLIKMKKLLADTEKKMFNRIKLFQKASEKVLKKKQHDMKVFQKLQAIKKDPIFSRTRIRPQTRDQNHRPLSRQYNLKNTRSNQNLFEPLTTHNRNSLIEDIESPRKILAERINQERLKNAKLMKEDHERNKIIIEQRKKRQLTRKLQSANIIRRERQKAKIVKEQVIKEKHDDFKKFMEEKYDREKQEFMKLQIHLHELQQREKQALITWKKTIEG